MAAGAAPLVETAAARLVAAGAMPLVSTMAMALPVHIASRTTNMQLENVLIL
jgi:hypothetical protein